MTRRQSRNDLIEKIAFDYLGVEVLHDRRNDALDFHDCHVESIRAALNAAFEAGRKAAATTEEAGR